MKTAEQRAQALWNALPPAAKVALDLNYRRKEGDKARSQGSGMTDWLYDVALSLKEHARDATGSRS